MIRHVIQANAMLLVQYAVASLIPLLLIPHIVSVIGLAEYGHIAVLLAWGGFGTAIVQYAFQMTGPMRVAQLAEGESPASIFADITLAKFLLAALVFGAMAIVVIAAGPTKSASSIAWILLFALPLAAGLNSVWYLQSQGSFLSVCILSIIGSLLTLLIGYKYVAGDNHRAVDFAVVASIFGALFTGAGTLMLAIVTSRAQRIGWSLVRAIDVLKQGWHLFISQFVSMLYSGVGPIVINYLLNAKAAGAYSVTERIVNAVMAATLLTHTAAYPRLAAAYVNDRPGYWRMLKLVVAGYLGVAFMISVLAWWHRESVVQFMYGQVTREHLELLLFGLAWFVVGIWGVALTGYLTVSGQSREVWPLTLKILLLSAVTGTLAVLFWGSAGWLAALVLSQSLVVQVAFRHWRKAHGK